MTLATRYKAILDWFAANAAAADSELHFSNDYELLVSVILSAQCTDKRVNLVTPALFAKWPDVKSLSHASAEEIYEYIKSVSYPNNKSHHLVGLARMLVSDFGGEVPSELEQLTKLPGVGRKTANVIQAVAFQKATMAVDTHVFRVSHRLGLVPASANTPLKVEQQLMKNIPAEDVPDAHHWLLLHGRYVCTSRKPHCEKCPFDSICPKSGLCL